MNNHGLLIPACLILVVSVQGAALMQTFDCNPSVVQNISPQGMGGLQTVYVYNGSLIQLDGSPWRDSVTGNVPPVAFPGMSIANVTNGSHLLKISLEGFEDFKAQVNICEHGITEVMVNQVPVKSTTTPQPADLSGVPPTTAGTGTGPLPAPTKAPGFALITAITAIATLCIFRKESFR